MCDAVTVLGMTLGPYTLRSELGRGAMAVVWRAYDPSLQREVAIKVPQLPVGLDSTTEAEFTARFVREARTAARLSHPNIVTVHAAEVYEGRPALVMELLEGETLGRVLTRGPVPPRYALLVADQLLDALGYAHQRGVVHRDVKPHNIFLSPEWRLKLTDFGIAHAASDTTFTQAGTVLGTPGYMAPEQVLGEPVDHRADLFAAGVVLYEMLSGRNPFGASEGLPATTVMYRIVHEQPPPLPLDALEGLPVDLRPALARALAKDPAARFASAEGFRGALQGVPVFAEGAASTATVIVDAGPVPHPGVPMEPPAPPAPPRRRSRLPYALAGAVVVAGVAVLVALALLRGGGSADSDGAGDSSQTLAPATSTTGSATSTTGTTSSATMADTLAPDVEITMPAAGSTVEVGRAVEVFTQATDDQAVAGVVVVVNGQEIGRLTSPPFVAAFTPQAPGEYRIRAQAEDRAGNKRESREIVVTCPSTRSSVTVTDGGSSTSTQGTWGSRAGWTVVLRSLPASDPGSEEQAYREADDLTARGYPAGVLLSTGYSSLNPGYWVLYSGQFVTKADAQAHQQVMRSAGYPEAYAREVHP